MFAHGVVCYVFLAVQTRWLTVRISATLAKPSVSKQDYNIMAMRTTRMHNKILYLSWACREGLIFNPIYLSLLLFLLLTVWLQKSTKMKGRSRSSQDRGDWGSAARGRACWSEDNGTTRWKEEPGVASGVEGRGVAGDPDIRGQAIATMDQSGASGMREPG